MAAALEIGYAFKDESLLALALTHPSLNRDKNNQRLEFLGDAVLGMTVAKMLYSLYPNESEGDLARRLTALVRGETLAAIARETGIGEALLLSAGEASSGGRTNPTNLEDALEALIGALYLDGGMEAVEAFVLPRWRKLAASASTPPKDAKTALQEWAQARGLPTPHYAVVETTGLAHAPEFTIEVSLPGHGNAKAKANAKRVAEQMAAQLLLERVSHGG